MEAITKTKPKTIDREAMEKMPFWTKKDIAKYYDVQLSTVYNWEKKSLLPLARSPKKLYIPSEVINHKIDNS